MYGEQIGKKFEMDGSARRYPGNTVIADVRPGCSAYDVMTALRQMAMDAGFADSMILLPVDSYHMTVLRGLTASGRKRSAGSCPWKRWMIMYLLPWSAWKCPVLSA